MITTHIGFGRFRLEQFCPGEFFARFDGTLCKVCERQPQRTLNPTPPHLLLPDHLQVWIEWGTSNATKVYLHRTALAHAISVEQARLIEARERERRPSCS